MSSIGASRRERIRSATTAEILATARQVLVSDGVDGLALRAIARELGMTAPALYRYFPSREDLVNHVIAQLYDELADELRQVRDAVEDPLVQLLEVARRFRRWALAHRREFGLLFASPVYGDQLQGEEDRAAHPESGLPNPAQAAGQRFAGVFAESFLQLYQRAPFPVPADDEIEPELRRQLLDWRERLSVSLPIGALQLFLTGWIRIYGMVSMEVFGHLRFAVTDGAAMYEHEINALAGMLTTDAP